jgi:hypothetical protein
MIVRECMVDDFLKPAIAAAFWAVVILAMIGLVKITSRWRAKNKKDGPSH